MFKFKSVLFSFSFVGSVLARTVFCLRFLFGPHTLLRHATFHPPTWPMPAGWPKLNWNYGFYINFLTVFYRFRSCYRFNVSGTFWMGSPGWLEADRFFLGFFGPARSKWDRFFLGCFQIQP